MGCHARRPLLHPSTAVHKGKLSLTGEVVVRDRGHGGMTLADFCALPRINGALAAPDAYTQLLRTAHLRATPAATKESSNPGPRHPPG